MKHGRMLYSKNYHDPYNSGYEEPNSISGLSNSTL